MDDIGTYVYLAFVIISIVAGLLRNRNKKNEESEPEQSTETRSLPDFGEIMARQRAQQEEAQRRLKEMEAKAQLVTVENSKHRASQGSKLREKRSEGKTSVDSSVSEDVLADFDPAKAIIYSEIIKNPHL